MRNKLRVIENKRKTFMGQFIRYGNKRSEWYYGNGETLLLKRVTEISSMSIVAEHLWISCSDNRLLDKLNLEKGDFIKFDATVKPYIKGYKGKRIDLIINNPKSKDYQLSNIANITVINEKVIL